MNTQKNAPKKCPECGASISPEVGEADIRQRETDEQPVWIRYRCKACGYFLLRLATKD